MATDKALRQSCRKSGQGDREGTGADTDSIGSPMLLKQSTFTLAIEQITVWMSASSRVMVLQLLLFWFSVPPQSKFLTGVVYNHFSTPSDTVLCSTHL